MMCESSFVGTELALGESNLVTVPSWRSDAMRFRAARVILPWALLLAFPSCRSTTGQAESSASVSAAGGTSGVAGAEAEPVARTPVEATSQNNAVAPMAAWTDPRRLFAGAPPVGPHAFDDEHDDCLNCHEQGGEVGADAPAPAVGHPQLVVCRQCHVERLTAADVPPPATTFVGLPRFGAAPRLYAEAPPVVPHPLGEVYTVCGACHSSDAPRGPVSPHLDRVNCRQCHVSAHGEP